MATTRRLPVLCPQEYDGCDMVVNVCNRCPMGWDASAGACTVTTGAEHFPLVESSSVPTCPMAPRCQHAIQVAPVPCAIRARGMICESALAWAGDADAASHPLAFNATTAATAEEWAEQGEVA